MASLTVSVGARSMGWAPAVAARWAAEQGNDMGKSADEQFRTGSMSIADYHRASEIERRERRVEMDRREEKLRQARQEKR